MLQSYISSEPRLFLYQTKSMELIMLEIHYANQIPRPSYFQVQYFFLIKMVMGLNV